MRLKTLAQKVKLTFEWDAKLDWDKQDQWQRDSNSYRCTLHYKGRQYSFDFWQGIGISHDPEVESVLDCLLSDSQGGEQGFEEFCSEFGYDSDSRKAERTHKACQKVNENMRRLLGEDYETFLQAERD